MFAEIFFQVREVVLPTLDPVLAACSVLLPINPRVRQCPLRASGRRLGQRDGSIGRIGTRKSASVRPRPATASRARLAPRLGSSLTTSGPRHRLAGKRRTRCTADDGPKENGTPAAFIAPGYFSAGWRYFSISGASSMEGIIPGTSLTFAACS